MNSDGTGGVERPCVGVMSKDVALREEFCRQLRERGAEPFAFESPIEVRSGPKERKYHGFVVDFKSLMGISMAEKSTYEVMEGMFPFMRIIVRGSELTGVVSDRGLQGEALFKDFVDDFCAPFPGKKIQRYPRTSKTIRLTWNGRRAVTSNVSEAGALIVECGELPKIEDIIEVKLKLSKQASEISLSASVCWTLAWDGDFFSPPGFGIEFLEPQPQLRINLPY